MSVTKFNKLFSKIYSNIPQSKQPLPLKSLQIHSFNSLPQSKHTLRDKKK